MTRLRLRELPFAQTFEDVTANAHKVDQEHFLATGLYPIVDQGQGLIAGYLNDDSLVWRGDLPVIVFGDHTRIIKYVDFPFVLGADGAKVLKPTPESWPKFTYYALLHLNIPSVGYSRHFKFLKESNLRFPDLPEQRRLAGLLDRADRLRRLRRYALELSETYLQSVFLEMFGDPVRNERGWEMCSFEDVLTEITYGLTVRPAYVVDGIPLISAREIRLGSIDFQSAPRISELDFGEVYRKGKPQSGDILFSKTGAIGHCAEVTSNRLFAITQNTARLVFQANRIANPFALAYLRSPYLQALAQREAKGNAVQDLQLGVIKQFPIPVPPLTVQQAFSRVAQEYERLCVRQREALRQVEHLFQTLLHQAFAGKL